MNVELGGEMGKPRHETFGGQKDGVQPPIDSVYPSDAGKTPREIKVREPGKEWTMTVRPPMSVTEIYGSVPPRYLYGIEKDTYLQLADEPLQVIHAQREGNSEAETIIVGPPVTALKINALLFFCAPDRDAIYGLDTPDLIEDWGKIVEDTEEAQKLRDAHGTMPGFNHFLDQRKQILDVIARNYNPIPHRDQVYSDGENFLQEDPDDVLIPVFRLITDDEGKVQIVLKAMDDDMRSAIAQTLPERFIDPDDAARMNTGIGLALAAAYAPKNTQWETVDTYIKHPEGELLTGPTQYMGPTQVLGLIYRNIALQQKGSPDVPQHHDLQASPLVAKLARYAETGEMPDDPALPDYPVQDIQDRRPGEDKEAARTPVMTFRQYLEYECLSPEQINVHLPHMLEAPAIIPPDNPVLKALSVYFAKLRSEEEQEGPIPPVQPFSEFVIAYEKTHRIMVFPGDPEKLMEYTRALVETLGEDFELELGDYDPDTMRIIPIDTD